MKALDSRFEPFRDRPFEVSHYKLSGDELCGVFKRWGLVIIATRADAEREAWTKADVFWDHVSVSHPSRCPTWEEMEKVKRWLFEGHETAMQLHVPASSHINIHPYCLHLWRPVGAEIPRPPQAMV